MKWFTSRENGQYIVASYTWKSPISITSICCTIVVMDFGPKRGDRGHSMSHRLYTVDCNCTAGRRLVAQQISNPGQYDICSVQGQIQDLGLVGKAERRKHKNGGAVGAEYMGWNIYERVPPHPVSPTYWGSGKGQCLPTNFLYFWGASKSVFWCILRHQRRRVSCRRGHRTLSSLVVNTQQIDY